MKAAYRGVKRGDPGALVIGGGLSPAAGGGGSMDDLEFLRGMYAAGVRGSMDAVAVHNYGGGFEPERDPGDCGICFRRAETYRQIMLDQGDGATPIWATEFGWLLDPGRDMGQYDWMRVSADKQAEYVVRAFRYARANWPWMGGLVLSNLDASTSPYHTGPQDGMPWFTILNKDYSPRPAWKAFKTWREQDRAALASRPQTAANAAPPAQTDPPPTVDIPAFPTPIPIPTPVPSATPTATVTVTSQPLPEPGPTDTPGPTPAVPSVATPIPSVATPMTTSQGLSTSAASVRVQVVRTDGTGVNLRARPRADAEALEVVPEDAFLDVVGDDVVADGRTWRNVQTAGGRTGWVAAQYLSP